MSDTWERVQLASARVPFRLKVAAVWVVLFAVLAFLGNAAQFDTQWIRDNFRYILGGLRYTMVIAVSVMYGCISPSRKTFGSIPGYCCLIRRRSGRKCTAISA